MKIQPIAVTFNGIRFRSVLEADWAATFTALGIYYQYEPEPVRLESGAVYDCDFYLPTMRTFCEAKGPHNERLEKVRELAAVLAANEFLPNEKQVIILRPAGPDGGAVWESAHRGAPAPLIVRSCGGCLATAFTQDHERPDEGYCRRCWASLRHSALFYQSADSPGYGNEMLPMVRAPRAA